MALRTLRTSLLASLTALLVIPIVLAMTLGTAALLGTVGDATAASACRWVSMGLGIVWAASVVATAALSAIVSLAEGRRASRRNRRHGQRRLDGQRGDERVV